MPVPVAPSRTIVCSAATSSRGGRCMHPILPTATQPPSWQLSRPAHTRSAALAQKIPVSRSPSYSRSRGYLTEFLRRVGWGPGGWRWLLGCFLSGRRGWAWSGLVGFGKWQWGGWSVQLFSWKFLFRGWIAGGSYLVGGLGGGQECSGSFSLVQLGPGGVGVVWAGVCGRRGRGLALCSARYPRQARV